ncbi:hypothetical protein BX600DRAFT_436680 [Xylariales sp. PMI_506]|nr:hypothetical protein BX600DRAFT_436680 [Xylariales sp. PMI_506]
MKATNSPVLYWLGAASTIFGAVATGGPDAAKIADHLFDGVRSRPSLVPIIASHQDEEVGFQVEAHGHLKKRGYYTCFNTATTSVQVLDCKAVINDIRAIPGNLTAPNGLCLMWYEGTCLSRFCSRPSAVNGVTRTSASLADELEFILLNNCVAAGQDGISGDCANMNANCGTYRASLVHHGLEMLHPEPPI